MKNIYFVLVFLLAGTSLFAQTHTGNLTLTTQAEVDAFKYDTITGQIFIKGFGITNIDSLYRLKSVLFGVYIDSTNIVNVQGLKSLKNSVPRSILTISNNPILENVDDLNPFVRSMSNSVGSNNILISNNPRLTSIDSLLRTNNASSYHLIVNANNELKEINLYNSARITNLTIKNNAGIQNLTLPSYAVSLQNLVVDNNTNLEAIRYIESPFYDAPSISITNNNSLTFIQEYGPFLVVIQNLTLNNNNSLTNLGFIEKFSNSRNSRINTLNINGNLNLINCCGIRSILERNAYTTLSLTGNPFPCNNVVQVVSNCDTVPRNFVLGRVYIDANSNNQADASDLYLKNIKIETETKGQTLVHLTNSSGEYYFVNDTGNYNVKPIFTYNNIQSVPESYTLSHVTFGNTDTLDFKISSDILVNDASVVLSNYGFTRPDRDNLYVITYGNESGKTYNGTISLTLDDRLSYTYTSIPPTSVNGNVLTWDISNLPMFTSKQIVVNILASSTLVANDVLVSEVVIGNNEADVKPNNNRYIFKDVVRASYDPNDKIVDKSVLSPAQVADSTYLYYTIRFQNIGNDTAFRVFIYDSLDVRLDWNTFDIVGSSHDFEFVQRNGVQVEFDFKNIVLPDSNVNEEASHGFITYKIRPKSSLAVGDIITNKARITFDVNLPIITNTTTTAIMETNAGEDRTICEGDAVVLEASGATSYTWSDGNSDREKRVSPDSTTTYYVTGTVGGIQQTDSVTVYVNPTKETQLTETIAPGENYDFNGTILTESGIYRDSLLQVNGCDSIIVLNLTVVTSTKNKISFVNSVKVFPNPASNYLSIDLTSEKVASFRITLFSVDGKALLEKNYQRTSTIQDKLDLSKLSSGMFHLRIESEGMQAIYSVIKQ